MNFNHTTKMVGLMAGVLALTACMPAEIRGILPSGGSITMQFYPGGNLLDDLVIFNGTNYFGTAQYQFDDPLGDIGFRFNDGERVQAECTLIGQDIIGQDECKRYEVYRSNWDKIPEGTMFERPDMF